MKLIKINLFALAVLALTSCLKSKNDLGGMREDEGSIVTTIVEPEYIRQDNEHVYGVGYYATACFDFAALPNEMVKFFSIHVAQARERKLSGPLRLKVSMTSIGSTPLPVGAITIPAEIEFPAFTGNSMDFSVKFAVNKALLNPAGDYAAHFAITGTNQGSVGQIDNGVDVQIYNGKYIGRYMVTTTITDPLNVVKMDLNIKPATLLPPSFYPATVNPAVPAAVNLKFVDEYYYWFFVNTNGLGTLANNLTTGTTATATAIVHPTFGLDASDNLIRVSSSLNGTAYNVTFNGDAPNKFVYTSNDDRTFDISYNVTVSAPIPGGLTAVRIFKIRETYKYHPVQVMIP